MTVSKIFTKNIKSTIIQYFRVEFFLFFYGFLLTLNAKISVLKIAVVVSRSFKMRRRTKYLKRPQEISFKRTTSSVVEAYIL